MTLPKLLAEATVKVDENELAETSHTLNSLENKKRFYKICDELIEEQKNGIKTITSCIEIANQLAIIIVIAWSIVIYFVKTRNLVFSSPLVVLVTLAIVGSVLHLRRTIR